MAARIISDIDSKQNYDFLFEEHNKLDENDIDVETDLHEIDIFGNNHLIAMGSQKQHPNNNELFYYIAYLIYDSKVVSKLGVYETDKRLSSMTHRTMNFALHELLIDSHYSKNPNALMAFINKSLNKPKNKGKEGEEEKVQGKEDELEEGELEEGELEEGEVSNEPKQLNTIQSWLKDKVKTIKNPSVTRVFNILRQFKKNTTSFDPQIDDGYLEYLFNNGKTIEIKSPFYITDESKIITKSVMIMYEYILNVKFIIINDDGTIPNFSMLESLSQDKMNEYYKKKTKENIKILSVFKRFNPSQLILLKKQGETYKVIRELNLEDETVVSDNKDLLKKIKDVFNNKPREHTIVDSTSFGTLKTVFEKLEPTEAENGSVLSKKIKPRSPNGPPPNRLNVNAGGAAEEVENKEKLNSINKLLLPKT